MSLQSITYSKVNSIPTWLMASLAALLAVIAFQGPLLELVRRWATQEEYSHGFLIPIIAIWLLWLRREALVANIGRPTWTSTAFILIAIVMHVVGMASAIFVLSQLGFILVIMGITLAVGGFSLLRVACIPIIFLIFAIPLPYVVNSNLSMQLQLVSSQLGTLLIQSLRVPVYLDGNVIDLGGYKLQVVDACSGLRYLFPLFSLSFLAAYLFRAPAWQRALVLLSSIPISILMNGLRIGMVGVTVDRWGPRMADEVLHSFEGWIVFLASSLLIALEIFALARLSGRGFLEAVQLPSDTARACLASRQPASRKPLCTNLLLITATVLTIALVSQRPEIVPERSRFVTFPATIGVWHGRPALLDPQIEQSLAMQDYILSDYMKSDGKVVDLYIGYYASQRTGESPHSPLFCIPGDGWSIKTFEQTSDGAGRPLNRAVIEKNGSKQLVYYWYEERGRRIANEYSIMKWYLLSDAIIKSDRSDGAIVRLITPILSGETEHDADGRLESFMDDMLPTLSGYLPSASASASQPLITEPTRH